MTGVTDAASKMLMRMKEEGKNKVLWWNNRSLILRAANQYAGLKCPAGSP